MRWRATSSRWIDIQVHLHSSREQLLPEGPSVPELRNNAFRTDLYARYAHRVC